VLGDAEKEDIGSPEKMPEAREVILA